MNVGLYSSIVWLLCFLTLCHAKTDAEVLLVIACPPHPRQAQDECFALAGSLREQHRQLNLTGDVALGDYVMKVHVLHELFNYWTLLDALPHLRSLTQVLSSRTEWIIWCQHNTHVASLRDLLENLRRQDQAEVSVMLARRRAVTPDPRNLFSSPFMATPCTIRRPPLYTTSRTTRIRDGSRIPCSTPDLFSQALFSEGNTAGYFSSNCAQEHIRGATEMTKVLK